MKQNGLISGFASTVSAVLLAVWYLLAVSGLDVHHDNEHGRTYVVCSLSGCDCEHIHPEAQCHDHDDGSDGECLADEECCSDDFEAVLSLSDSQGEGLQDLSAPCVVLSGLLPGFSAPATVLEARDFRGLAPPPDPVGYFLKLSVLRA